MFASMPNIEPENARQTIEVACGVIVGDDGEVLLAQRPAGKLAGGKWEFPGGKIEPGESAAEALGREMDEELGIRVEAATFLARLQQRYHGRMVLLDTWRIDAYEGRPVARESQKLAWVPPARVPNYDVLPSCWKVLAALQLPKCYVFTPADQALEEWFPSIGALPHNALLRLRRPKLNDDRYYSEAVHLLPVCVRNGLSLVLDRDPAHVASLGAAGWHADGEALQALKRRPLSHGYWCLASTHDATQLRQAWQADLDAAVLGPVQETPSHPGGSPLGWGAFSTLARQAGLPVYAIGGVGPDDLPIGSWQEGGIQRIAGITAYWPLGE